jgi:hypothetical protein
MLQFRELISHLTVAPLNRKNHFTILLVCFTAYFQSDATVMEKNFNYYELFRWVGTAIVSSILQNKLLAVSVLKMNSLYEGVPVLKIITGWKYSLMVLCGVKKLKFNMTFFKCD